MCLSEEREEQNIILSCDFVKCFDRCEFECIKESLKYFNFPEILVEWVELLYSEFTIRIQNNGYFSERIKVTRSIHQGGCCSAELFIICAEILAIMLRKSEKIKGVELENLINLINQFADDLNATLSFQQESLDEVMNIFETFRLSSGFTLSYEKTTVFRIGSLKYSEAKLYTQFPLNWSNDPIKILGVWISHDTEQIFSLNYDPILLKMKAILNSWEHRNLTLYGKILVVNSLIASFASLQNDCITQSTLNIC